MRSEAEILLQLFVHSYFNLIDQLRKREGYTYAALDDLAMRADALLRKGE